jgi:D-amino-acid dehydrogenase
MRILVIGGGLIGVTSAYSLRRLGHEVTVIDRQPGPARETSFANGALLTPSMSDPWNAPGCWRTLLASLGRTDSPLELRLRALPALAGWGVRFLRNSYPAAFERNTRSNLRLALGSLRRMASLREETRIEYDRAARGALRVFRDAVALDQARAAAERWRGEGVTHRRLSSRETVDLEPALAPIAEQLAGAILYEADETGDAYQFCLALADRAREQGVVFRFETAVASLEVHSGRWSAALGASGERFVADHCLVAAGSDSAPLLRRLGIDLPVRPVKGYSVTLKVEAGRSVLRIPVVDDALHAAIVPLAGAIRVAGTAEFAGYDLTLRAARIRNLLNLLRQVLPREPFDADEAEPWCGLRPMSVDGVPVIGPTPLPNLWVNTGHGHLGWTLAAGSAQLLAELMGGLTPTLDPRPYALARFAAGRPAH